MKVTNCLSMKPVRLGLCNKLHRVSKRQACRFATWIWLETWLLPCAQCSMYIRVISATSNLSPLNHSRNAYTRHSRFSPSHLYIDGHFRISLKYVTRPFFRLRKRFIWKPCGSGAKRTNQVYLRVIIPTCKCLLQGLDGM